MYIAILLFFQVLSSWAATGTDLKQNCRLNFDVYHGILPFAELTQQISLIPTVIDFS